MALVRSRLLRECAFSAADDIIRSIRSAGDWDQLRSVVRDFTDEMGFRFFAIVTHQDLRDRRPGAIDLRDYAEGASRRIIGECGFRRDPVMRACIFADSAFLWSELRNIIALDGKDRLALELGRREGLNEGITVPCGKLGHHLGSCTFAGLRATKRGKLLIGPAQMFGVFAFQRARILAGPTIPVERMPRLDPRYRDCVVLAGRGLKDKIIAHRLGITPRTVESYLRDARRLFGARDRTELVSAALLGGEIALAELRPRQEP